MARVERLRIYPVKGLEGVDRDSVELGPGGTLAGDREFALFGSDGGVINGKRTDAVHRLATTFDPETTTLSVGERGEGPTAMRRFDLSGDTAAAERWFARYFGCPVELRRNDETGFVDRPAAGPSVVSTATIETVASWFDDLAVESMRRRLRANIEIGGVEAFWEDQFVGDDAPTFEVLPMGSSDGTGIGFEGIEPCGRCVVPTRDPDTGEPTPRFRERFIERRAATFPDHADADAFPHRYAVMLIAAVSAADRGRVVSIGDAVRIIDDRG